jgi:prepilin-type processing-associated H-X9-DG protein
MRGVQTNRRAALTLVELLVVMGIVAILIALILSVVARVRASAMRSACANNLRQIGHGLALYDQAYGRLPGSEAHKTLSDLPSFLDALTRLRACGAETFVCPVSGVEPSSYDLNLNYAGRPMSTGRGDIVLASERSVASCVGCHESDGTARNVHRSGSNSLFFDGHVEAIPTSKPVGGTSRPTK